VKKVRCINTMKWGTDHPHPPQLTRCYTPIAIVMGPNGDPCYLFVEYLYHTDGYTHIWSCDCFEDDIDGADYGVFVSACEDVDEFPMCLN